MLQTADDLGKLLLRVTIGVLMLMHGIPKVIGGIGFVKSLLASHHLPTALGYFVYVGEVVAPILLLVGLYARVGGLLVAINMVVAIALAHSNQIFSVTKNGAWALELQGLYLFGGLVIALIGAGRFSAGGKNGTLN
ncbi:DoxX family protein [Pigmentiphaga sp.]|jgi:Predicted membrane protein|uniref:DoxX family protein n=1 Tax=Pigmentiphaga sp. TaxID=1977564 RepID=UPI0025E1953F|nr:DoxX family protein [Pigmentiphaga sp.]MBX6317278.1 DoxX family protein [Pigmentiphaga sp.]